MESNAPAAHPAGQLALLAGYWTLGWRPAGRPDVTALAIGRALREGTAPPLPASRVSLEQVHGREVVVVRRAGPAGAADAAVTLETGLALSVRVADCAPVALVSPLGLALAHAGWRGTAAGVAPRALRTLLELSGERPEEVTAWVGPAIGVCCYEVGEEVARAMPEVAVRRRAARFHVDLALANRRQLMEAGIPPERIELSGWCTRCHQHLFHSHRGSGGRPGRLIVLLQRLAPGAVPHPRSVRS